MEIKIFLFFIVTKHALTQQVSSSIIFVVFIKPGKKVFGRKGAVIARGTNLLVNNLKLVDNITP